jgi:hypothetical protein
MCIIIVTTITIIIIASQLQLAETAVSYRRRKEDGAELAADVCEVHWQGGPRRRHPGRRKSTAAVVGGWRLW